MARSNVRWRSSVPEEGRWWWAPIHRSGQRSHVKAKSRYLIQNVWKAFFYSLDLAYLKVNGVIPFDDWSPPGTVFSRKWLYALPLSAQSVATDNLSAGKEAEFSSRLYFEMKWGQKTNGFFDDEDVWSLERAKTMMWYGRTLAPSEIWNWCWWLKDSFYEN